MSTPKKNDETTFKMNLKEKNGQERSRVQSIMFFFSILLRLCIGFKKMMRALSKSTLKRMARRSHGFDLPWETFFNFS
jgi:hypothetical protein